MFNAHSYIISMVLNVFCPDPQLSSYQRKKYVAKLIFVYILGYKVDVGHFEAANLVTSNKYTEKQIVSMLF